MTFPHWSRVTLYASSCELAECYVFVKQSHGPFHCASRHCPEGPLLPKLRGHVAEFLNEVSLARLGMFVPSHLCRFWYGRRRGREALFWEAWVHAHARGEPRARPDGCPVVRRIAIDPRHCPSPTLLFRPPPAGRGMLTPCPSATPFGLALGPG